MGGGGATAERGAIVVAPPQAEDAAAWRTLWSGYLDLYRAHVAEEVYTETWRRVLTGERLHALLAWRSEGGPPIGLTHFLYHPHAWRLGPVCYLQDLYVADAARGLGAGRALIEAVYAAADSAGAEDVYWTTQSGNAQARALYDRIGRATDFMKYVRR